MPKGWEHPFVTNFFPIGSFCSSTSLRALLHVPNTHCPQQLTEKALQTRSSPAACGCVSLCHFPLPLLPCHLKLLCFLIANEFRLPWCLLMFPTHFPDWNKTEAPTGREIRVLYCMQGRERSFRSHGGGRRVQSSVTEGELMSRICTESIQPD